MPQPACQTLYPYQLCERGIRLQGDIPLSSLAPVADILSVTAGVVLYDVTFSRDAERYCRLEVKVQAQLPLDCQRCLTTFQCSIATDSLLSPVRGEQEMQRLPDVYEPLLVSATESVVLSELIAEELILAMPLMPKHPDQQCPSSERLGYPASVSTQSAEQLTQTPFAVLRRFPKTLIPPCRSFCPSSVL